MTSLALFDWTPPPPFAPTLQHVLVMYAGAVAVSLILGAALTLPRNQVALLINGDLFACGIATFMQASGVGLSGIRLPLMTGVTFASVIAAGIFGIFVAPFTSPLLPLFPTVVTGLLITGFIITVIGITLMRIGID